MFHFISSNCPLTLFPLSSITSFDLPSRPPSSASIDWLIQVKHGNGGQGLEKLAEALKKLINEAITKATTSLQHKSDKLSCSQNPHDPNSYCSQLDEQIKSKNEELNEAKNSNKTSEISSLESKIKQLQSNKDDCTKSHFMDQQRASSLEEEVHHGIDVIVKLTQFSGSEKSIETLIDNEIKRLEKLFVGLFNTVCGPSVNCKDHKDKMLSIKNKINNPDTFTEEEFKALTEHLEGIKNSKTNCMSHHSNDPAKLEELKRLSSTLADLKNKKASVESNKTGSCKDLLNNLCSGLEKFLGYQETSKGYSGSGIVYSDLDRLCDGVMAFLLQCLRGSENLLSHYYPSITSTISDLENKIGKGSGVPEFAQAIGIVRDGLQGYESVLSTKTEDVKTQLTSLIATISELNNEFNNMHTMSLSDQLKTVVAGAAECSLKAIGIELANSDLDEGLRIKLTPAVQSVKQAVRTLKNAANDKDVTTQAEIVDATLDQKNREIVAAVEYRSQKLRQTLDNYLDGIQRSLERLSQTKDAQFLLVHGSVEEAKTFVQDILNEYEDNYRSSIIGSFEDIKEKLKELKKEPAANNKSQLRRDVEQIRWELQTVGAHVGQQIGTLDDWKTKAQLVVSAAVFKCNGIIAALKPDAEPTFNVRFPEIQRKAKELNDAYKAATIKISDLVDKASTAHLKLQKIKEDVQVPQAMTSYTGGDWDINNSISPLTSKISSNVKNYVKELTQSLEKAAGQATWSGNTRPGVSNLVGALQSGRLGNELRELGELFHQANLKAHNNLTDAFYHLEITLNHFKQSMDNWAAIKFSSKPDPLKSLQDVFGKQAIGDVVDNEVKNLIIAAAQKGVDKLQDEIKLDSQITPLGGFTKGVTEAVSTIDNNNGDIEVAIQQVKTQLGTVSKMVEKSDNKDSVRDYLSALNDMLSDGTKVALELKELKGKAVKGIEKIRYELNDLKISELAEHPGKIHKAIHKVIEAVDELELVPAAVDTAQKESEKLMSRLYDNIVAIQTQIEKIGPIVNKAELTLNQATEDVVIAFKAAQQQAQKAVQTLRTTLTKKVQQAFSTLTHQVHSLFAKQKQAELTQLQSVVTAQLAEIQRVIEKDKATGVKGFLGELKSGITTHLKTSQAPLVKGIPLKQLAIKTVGYLDALFEYVDGELRPRRSPSQPADSHATKLSEIQSHLSKLLDHLINGNNKSYNFDHTFRQRLASLTQSVKELSSEKFGDGKHPELLNLLKGGTTDFCKEFEYAYINAYEGHPDTYFEWTRKINNKHVLTEDAVVGAKICVSILTIIHDDLSRLKNYFISSKSIDKINLDTLLGKYLHKCGYRVPDVNKQNNEIQNQIKMQGQHIYKCITDSTDFRSLFNTDKDYKHSLEIICSDYIRAYYQICHLSTFSAKKHPCSVNEMLVWLNGLQFNSVYDKLGGHLKTLFPKPNEINDEQHGKFAGEQLKLFAHPQTIMYEYLLPRLKDICRHSQRVLATIVGTGDAKTMYACEYSNNKLNLYYPQSAEACFDVLISILRKLFPVFRFLQTQCQLKIEYYGWSQCTYGNTIQASCWQCGPHSAIYQSSDHKCSSTSPLHLYLTDGLRGMLPHHVTSVGCTSKCNTCPKSTPGMPCLTPLGFTRFSGTTRKGEDLCKALTKFLSNDYVKCLFTLVPKPPSTLPEHFNFAMSLVRGWQFGGSKHDNDLQKSLETSIDDLSISLLDKSSQLTDALRDAYGESDSDHSTRSHVAAYTDLSSLSRNDYCSDSYVHCAPYLHTLCSDSYAYLAHKNANLYLSWAIYLPWNLWNLLKHLLDAFQNIDCKAFGCSAYSTTPGQHGDARGKTLDDIDARRISLGQLAGQLSGLIGGGDVQKAILYGLHSNVTQLIKRLQASCGGEGCCNYNVEKNNLNDANESLKNKLNEAQKTPVNLADILSQCNLNELQDPLKQLKDEIAKKIDDLNKSIEELKQLDKDGDKSKNASKIKELSKSLDTHNASKRSLETLKELCDFADSLKTKNGGECEKLLTNLCSGLQTFLGYNPNSKGYSGDGIVYSDLDRLCDGVMSFLHGVLESVKDDESVKKYDGYIKLNNNEHLHTVLQHLQSSIGQGRSVFGERVEEVSEWLKKYWMQVNDKTGEVKTKLGKYYKEVEKQEGKELQVQLREWQSTIGKIQYNVDTIDNHVSNIDPNLRDKLRNEMNAIGGAVRTLNECADETVSAGQAAHVEEQLKKQRMRIENAIEAQTERVKSTVTHEINKIFEHLGSLGDNNRAHLGKIREAIAMAKGTVESEFGDYSNSFKDKVIECFIGIRRQLDNYINDANSTTLQKSFQAVKTEVGLLEGNVRNGLQALRERISGLVDKVTDQVGAYDNIVEGFKEKKFEKKVEEWVEHILKENKTDNQARNYYKKSLGAATLIPKVEQAIKSVIKTKLSGEIEGAGRIVKYGIAKAEKSNEIIKEYVDAVKKACDSFAEKLREQIEQNGITASNVADVIKQDSSVLDSHLNGRHDASSLAPAVRSTLLQLLVVATKAGNHSLGWPTKWTWQKRWMMKLYYATSPAVRTADQKESPAQTLNTSILAIKQNVDHLENIFTQQVAKDLAKEVDNFNHAAKVEILLAAKTAMTHSVNQLGPGGSIEIKTIMPPFEAGREALVNAVKQIEEELKNLKELPEDVATQKSGAETEMEKLKRDLLDRIGQDAEQGEEGEKEDSEESKKVAEIQKAVDKLLSHLSKSDKLYNFDYEFQLKLSALTDAVNALSAEKFAGHQNPELLDALKKGMLGVTGELKHAYVNRYDSQKFTENLVDAKYELTPSNNTTIITLRDYGRKCSKVCATVLFILFRDMRNLRKRCPEKWTSNTIYSNTGLGTFLKNSGYRVSNENDGHDGELRNKSKLKGEHIYDLMTKQHGQSSQTYRIVDDYDDYVDQTSVQNYSVLKRLYNNLECYNEVCHHYIPEKPKSPSNIYQMLQWCSGLQYNYMFEKVCDYLMELFGKPDGYKDSKYSDIPSALLKLDAHPETITYSSLITLLKKVCQNARKPLIAVLGYGHADGVYAVDHFNNSSNLSYPSSAAVCFDMLLDILQRLYQQLYFVLTQCLRGKSTSGWRDCHYGRHVVTNHRGIPCKTPMGFGEISTMASQTQKGERLMRVLRDLCGDSEKPLSKLCGYLVCLTHRAPQNLGDMFAFYQGFIMDYTGGFYGNKESPVHTQRALKDAVTEAYFGQEHPFDPSPLYGSIGHVDSDIKGDLYSISTCTSDSVNSCGLFVQPLTLNIYRIFSSKHKSNYLSWIVYLTETFYDLLKKLFDECDAKCGAKGSNCHNKCCVKKCPVSSKTSTPCNHDSECRSIVKCQNTLPTLYRHGFTYGNAESLNGEYGAGKKRTCKDFCKALKNVLNEDKNVEAPLAKLIYVTIPDFLWKIREPFSLTLLALWSLSLLYLLHIAVVRLDVLRIRSHLRSPSSHRIAAQSLLAAARVRALANVKYFSP
ncbi:hypothetical protein, conserved [Babesia ovata]|uniref:Extracellular matrix-binding ebh n=1 Tax=Babesia ovata TaxID=189622 RepID=A0A2H6KJH0_9APIC|nr:uncharacterized protein BOVATA_046350 [Babesia ovata]GBE63142.1 hypothetical protein, conserved [Babesia ovata]